MKSKIFTVFGGVLLLGCLFAGYVCSSKLLHMDFPIMDFSKGVLGGAAYHNVDIAAVKRVYFFYALVVCPLALGLGMFLYRRVSGIRSSAGHPAGWRKSGLLDRVQNISAGCPFGAVVLLLLGVNLVQALWRCETAPSAVWVVLAGVWVALAVIFLAVWLLCAKRKCLGSLNGFYILGLAISTVLNVFVSLLGASIQLFLYVPFLVLWAGVTLLVYGALWRMHDFSFADMRREEFAFKPLFLAAAALPLFLEILYILSVYHIFISSLVLCVPYAVSFIFCWKRWKRYSPAASASGEEEDGGSVYFWALAAVVWVPFYHGFLQGGPIDFFEGANHGLGLYDFFQGWGWPVLANFDAHMLFVFLGGVFYGARTQDVLTAIFSPDFYIIQALPLWFIFFLFRYFVGYRKAYILVLLNAFLLDFTWTTGFGLLIYFAYWTKHISRTTNAIFAGLFWFSCIFRLDIAVSYGGAFLLCGVLWLWLRNRQFFWSFVKLQILAAGAAGVLAAGAFACQGVDVRSWLARFLVSALSDQNWAYGILGTQLAVAFLYIAAPIALSGILIFCVLYIKKRQDDLMIWCMLFLYIAWALNIPRALVRHNMVEHSVIAYGIPLLLTALFLIRVFKNGGILVFVLLTLLLVEFAYPMNIYSGTMMQMPALAPGVAEHRTGRPINAEDSALIQDMKGFLDANAAPDETYLDFTNQSLLYAFVGRKNPVWVNQSPGLVNGIAGQREFLQEIQQAKVPFVLMPYERDDRRYVASIILDGVLNVDRYYLLTEYIGENYRPLCVVGKFAVWCRKQDYERLRQNNLGRKMLDTYDYCDTAYYHHDMGAIPFLWGNCSRPTDDHWSAVPDGITAIGGSANEYQLDRVKAGAGAPAFISVEIHAEADGRAMLALSGAAGDKSVVYDFRVMRGNHRYRLRCSSDILWYGNTLDKIKVQLEKGQKLQNIFLEREDG